MKFNPDSVLRSALRLGQMSKMLKDNPNPYLFKILRKECGYLVRRSIALWLKLTFGRK